MQCYGETSSKNEIEGDTESNPNENKNTIKTSPTKPKRFMCQICKIYFRTVAQVVMHNTNFKDQHIEMIKAQMAETGGSSLTSSVKVKRFRSCKRLFDKPCEAIGDIPLTNAIIKENNYTLQQVFESHTKVDGIYTCKVCGKLLRSRVTFIVHLRNHTGDWVAYCKPCERGFTRIHSYQMHQKQHNEQTVLNVKMESTNWKCEICRYSFKSVGYILWYINCFSIYLF